MVSYLVFPSMRKNGGKRTVFDNFVNSEPHGVGGIDHGSMPEDIEIKFSND